VRAEQTRAPDHTICGMRPVANAGSIDAGAIGHSGAFAQGFAARALLAMVADTMLPEAYETEQGFTGSLVAVGFAVSLILSSL
jgi:hypothetical protein